ncbi:MAG: hypothetical protein ACAH80_09255 [Alphaproteobacteria bacterium]
MTLAKPSLFDKKMMREFGVLYGGGLCGAGGLLGYAGLAGLSAIIATGLGGVAAVAMGAAYAATAAAGLWCFVRGTVRMHQVFSNTGKSWAEREFENNPEAFALKPIAQEVFNPQAQKAVKVMRPLKIAPRNKPLDLPRG